MRLLLTSAGIKPDNKLVNAEKWAAGMEMRCYAIDDETAIQVVNGDVNVISEGTWKRFDL
jgi:dipeptidase E